jgi:hypothetical protein
VTKSLLNPNKDRYVSFEGSYSLHRLASMDETKLFYYTICGKPMSFEEDFKTHKTGVLPVYMIKCEICIPERLKDWSEFNWGI